MKRTILPTSFKDILALISLIGFIGIFLLYVLNIPIINDSMTAIFLILGGVGFMMIGKVLKINTWLKDGLQESEYTMLFVGILGIGALIVGFLLLFNVQLDSRITSIAGWLALGPALFIAIDYYTRNV